MAHPFMLLLIMAIWSAGAAHRLYRQARFYQIEEYQSLRYLRWLFSSRARWLPTRPLLAALAAAGSVIIFGEAPGLLLPAALALISAIIGAVPPPLGEIKRKFTPTNRAKRMLAAGGILLVGCSIGIFALLNTLASDQAGRLQLIGASLGGLALLLAAPIFLIAGNLVMQPVELLLRRRFLRQAQKILEQTNPIVIGITGSYGKTSTKHYLAHILNGRYKAYPTPKSYNTLMGVSLAINRDLSADRSIDYFIAEMGAYIPGEIARICKLTRPQISMVIEVGPQHLERFGSLENIAIAKYEIIKALPPDGVGIFNWDNPYVRGMYERGYPNTRIAVSKTVAPEAAQADAPHLIATEIEESLDGLRFRVIDRRSGQTEIFATNLLGVHNVTNILMAAAVALHEGMPLREIAQRVRSLEPAESRLVRQTTAEGITILNDAYSANPAGIVSALNVLAMHQSGRRLLITPGMVELGPLMEQENHKLGQLAAQKATDVILVGAQQTEPIKAGLLSMGFAQERLLVVETLSEAVNWYQQHLRPGDTVLFLNDLPDTYTS